jgi:serine/threonine protein kinase
MISKSSLGVSKELAEGSFGNVYAITNPFCRAADGQRYVYKEYKEYAKPNVDTLVAFTDFYHDLSTSDKGYLDSICCWPHELVEDGSKVSGFLMVQIPEKFFCAINFSAGPKAMEAKFEHLLLPDRLLERRQILLTDKARYKLLFSVVRGLNFFHGLGVCVGDFSHSNLLFSLRDCSVFFLDCDSFSLNGDTVFPQTETGNWGVAEKYPDEAMGTASSDIYKLGLLALRLLMESDDPAHYQASTNTDRLPPHIDAGIKAVIESSLKEAQNRPTLAEWSAALHSAITNCVSEAVLRRTAGASSTGSTLNRAEARPRTRSVSAPVSTGSNSASQVFNVFPTSATSSLPPKVQVQYGESGWKPVEVTRSQYQQKPSTSSSAQQSPDPNAQPQKKQGSGKLAVASFVLSIGSWAFNLIERVLWDVYFSYDFYFYLWRFTIPFIWVAFLLAFIFGLIGVRHRPKRGFAIAGLALSILPVAALVLGLLQALFRL